jgi:hypothetical protein
MVEYRCDGGDWESIPCKGRKQEDNKGNCYWDVPHVESSDCELKVTYSQSGGCSGADVVGPFTIMARDSVLISPDGGEEWFVDSSYWITWHPCFGPNVSISYSYLDTLGVRKDSVVEHSWANTGWYYWTVPNTPSAFCYLKVCDRDHPANCDSSDESFFICDGMGPKGYYRLIGPTHWYHPPLKVLSNQSRTIAFRVFSIGCEALTYSVSSDHPCIQASVPPTQLEPRDSIEISVLLDGTGACDGTFIAGNVILTTDEGGGTVDSLRVHAVVANDYYECPRDPQTVDTLENDYIGMYVNANCQQWIHDVGWVNDTTFEVFSNGGTIVATTDAFDTLVGRFMGDNDWRAGAQDKLYLEECNPSWEPHFWILFTKDIYIEASHLAPPAHFKWFWWEIAKQVKFFNPPAPEYYQRMVIKYVKVKRKDPPGWWPDQTPFTDHEDTYIGFAMDLDAPYDTSGPETGDESACNRGRYDAIKNIAYVTGFGREHPDYNNYHAGIALAEVNGVATTAPYGTANVKNNQYLYPQSPWGWKDGELYQLASTPGNYIQDGPASPDSVVDRSIVFTAHKIPAGTDANAKAEFTIVEVLAPNGLAQMRALVDTARAIVARERPQFPAICGDVNEDGVVNVGDIVCLVTYLYKSGPRPSCPVARGDVNNDGVINVGDVVYLVTFLYKSGPEPNCPGIWYWY